MYEVIPLAIGPNRVERVNGGLHVSCKGYISEFVDWRGVAFGQRNGDIEYECWIGVGLRWNGMEWISTTSRDTDGDSPRGTPRGCPRAVVLAGNACRLNHPPGVAEHGAGVNGRPPLLYVREDYCNCRRRTSIPTRDQVCASVACFTRLERVIDVESGYSSTGIDRTEPLKVLVELKSSYGYGYASI